MIELSIIIPYYNAEPYTSELLDVLAPQVAVYSDTVEVIVVDDGSSPEFNTKYDFVRIIRKKNGGTASARNRGLEEAAGWYIQFIDADDMVPGYFIEKLLHKIHISEADVIDFSWKSLDHTGAQADLQLIEDKTFLKNPSASTRCFKRSFIGDIRFNENKDTTEDEDFSRRLGYLFDDTPMFKVSMAEYMYYYRTGVVGSQSKKYKKGLKRTRRVAYYYDHVTADMTWLVDEIRKEDEHNEVKLLTKQCDIPELKRWCQITGLKKTWAHVLRGEKTSLVEVIPVPLKYDIVLYCNKLNTVSGITSFIYHWAQYFKDEYKICLLYDKIEDTAAQRFKGLIDVIENRGSRPIACETIILNRLNDVIPANATYKKSIQICHACKYGELHIPKGRDYLVNVSDYAKQSWGQEAAGGIVIRNMVRKSEANTLILVSATRIGAGDKGDNDKRFRILSDKLNRAGIPFIWFNFSDKPLPNAPRNFINLPSRNDIQPFMQIADYVVQLSTYEACSMTVQEALVNNTPVICCPVPSHMEQGVVDGINAHVVPFDMDFDVNILRDIPSFGYAQDIDAIKDKWRELLAAPPVPHKVVRVKVIRKYKDIELGKSLYPGCVLEMSRERAEHLAASDLRCVEIIG